jgi:hypothetical protein
VLPVPATRAFFRGCFSREELEALARLLERLPLDATPETACEP